MKRETPKEVWLYKVKGGGWDLSLDPPRKRYAKQFVRMVPDADAEVKRLRKRDKVLTEFVEHVGKFGNDPKTRKGKRWDILSDVLNDIAQEAREMIAALKPQVTRERKRR